MLRLAGGSKGDGNPLTESNDDGVHVGTTQNLQLSLSLMHNHLYFNGDYWKGKKEGGTSM